MRPYRSGRPGGKGIRTPGLLIANETLYQLSYTPIIRGRIISASGGSRQALFKLIKGLSFEKIALF
jgi:hypothetical protein